MEDSDFRKMFEFGPSCYLVLNPDFTIIAVSNAYLNATMTVRENIVGRGLFDVFPDNPDDLSATGTSNLRASLNRVLKNKKPDPMAIQKYDIRRPESAGGGFEVRYWSPVNSPILDAENNVKCIVHRAEDVTEFVHIKETGIEESKLNEELKSRAAQMEIDIFRRSQELHTANGQLRSAHEELDQFFSVSLDMLCISGADGYFKKVNPAFETVLGYTAEEFCSKPYLDFIHPEDIEKTRNEVQRQIALNQQVLGFENRYRCKNGSYKLLSWKSVPVGQLMYAAARDVTEIRQAEVMIRESNRELELRVTERVEELKHSEAQVRQLQKMDAIGTLAGGVAHDFNNILGAITMYCDLLLEEGLQAEDIALYSNGVMQAAEKGAALTRQLLIFSRKNIVQQRPINLNELINTFKKMLDRMIGENIQIETKFASDLKSIKADPSQIEQVIMNLVINARDAMPNGGKITIESSNITVNEKLASMHLPLTPGPHVVLTISDTGCGMGPEVQSRLFEPFFTTKPQGKGTGLGLTTAYGIVKQCEGGIWLYSEEGKGSIFKIYLPTIEESASTELKIPKTQLRAGRGTILLAEDEENLRRLFSITLKKHGYEVMAASNGREALKMLEENISKIDLLLTDIMMPEIGGIELAKIALAKRPELLVLYMSGYADDQNGGRLDQDQEVAFLQKPFDTYALLSKIKDILKS